MLHLQNETPPDAPTSEGAKSECPSKLSGANTTTTADGIARKRYSVDSKIKRLLKLDAKRIAADLYPWQVHRQTSCTWVQVANNVTLGRTVESNRHHYKGLATCGSVWVCPICSSKISERRRLEVAQAVKFKEAAGLHPVMVSFTFPHRVNQKLSDLLKRQQDAMKRLRETRAYKSLMAKLGADGRIRALEVTHGSNGWHPHTHELFFVATAVDAEELRKELAGLWAKACHKAGLFNVELHDLDAFLAHGVHVVGADSSVSAYLSKMDDQGKWTISHEMTKSSSKQGRASGRHPFALVDDSPELFLEYAHAMKGARQLVWSRGLKDQVGLDEKTDQEVVDEEVAKLVDSFHLPMGSWRYVTGNDARAEVLEAANRGGVREVLAYLEALGWSDRGAGVPPASA